MTLWTIPTDPPRVADHVSTSFIIVSFCSIASYIYLILLTFFSVRTRITAALLMLFAIEMCLQIFTVPSAVIWGANVPKATGQPWCVAQSKLREFFLHLMTGGQALVLFAVWRSIDTRSKWNQFSLKWPAFALVAICLLLQVVDMSVEGTHAQYLGVRGGRLYCDTDPDFGLYLKQTALLVAATFGLFMTVLSSYAFYQHFRYCRRRRIPSNLPISLCIRVLLMCILFIIFSLWQPIARFQQAAAKTPPANQLPITEFMTGSWGLVTLFIFSPMTTTLIASSLTKCFPNLGNGFSFNTRGGTARSNSQHGGANSIPMSKANQNPPPYGVNGGDEGVGIAKSPTVVSKNKNGGWVHTTSIGGGQRVYSVQPNEADIGMNSTHSKSSHGLGFFSKKDNHGSGSRDRHSADVIPWTMQSNNDDTAYDMRESEDDMIQRAAPMQYAVDPHYLQYQHYQSSQYAPSQYSHTAQPASPHLQAPFPSLNPDNEPSSRQYRY